MAQFKLGKFKTAKSVRLQAVAHTQPEQPPQRPLLGIGMMVLGMLAIPPLDVCAKVLSQDYPVMQVVWSRYFFHFLLLIPLLAFRRIQWWHIPKHPKTHVLRSILLLLSTIFFFIAIKQNPIPNALALLFVSPLIVTGFAPLFLGERFQMNRAGAALCGFIGVLVVLQPTTDAFQPSILFAGLAGASYAFYIMTTRKVSNNLSPLLTLFYTAIVGMLVMSFIAPFNWITPDLRGWLIMALMGAFAALGHYLIILACEFASASLVAPFNYVEIVGATLVSFMVFGYFPNLLVWVGIAIICASGVYISLVEYRQSRKHN